jgi:hypothetical protein
MTAKHREDLVVFSWFVWILICLLLIGFGFMIFLNWWKLDYRNWGRIITGFVFMLFGRLFCHRQFFLADRERTFQRGF